MTADKVLYAERKTSKRKDKSCAPKLSRHGPHCVQSVMIVAHCHTLTKTKLFSITEFVRMTTVNGRYIAGRQLGLSSRPLDVRKSDSLIKKNVKKSPSLLSSPVASHAMILLNYLATKFSLVMLFSEEM